MTVRVRGRVPNGGACPSRPPRVEAQDPTRRPITRSSSSAIGLLCGLTVVVLLVRRLRAHGAAADAARAMERSARVELCVARVAQTVERVEREFAGIARRPRLIGR